MDEIDLYAIHEQKAKDGLLTIHPSRWLYAGRRFGQVISALSSEHQAVRIGTQLIEYRQKLAEVRLDGKVRHKHGFYFATPAVADRYLKYVPEGRGVECAVRDMLLLKEPEGRIEVHTPVGFVDLLSPTTIVEVKSLTKWKQALGQVLAYSTYYPRHFKILHLYGHYSETPKLAEHVHVCKQFAVDLQYQSLLPGPQGPASRVDAVVTPSRVGNDF